MSNVFFAECAELLYGEDYTAEMARDLGVKDRSVQRWASGEWLLIPPEVWRRVEELLREAGDRERDYYHEYANEAATQATIRSEQMSNDVLTLGSLERAFKRTQKRATPHREPDFRKIKRAVNGDPPVRGSLVFLEEHNTGYAGLLERYMMSIPAEHTKANLPLRFQIDLLPGLIGVQKKLSDPAATMTEEPAA